MNEHITKLIIQTLGKQGVIDSRAFGHWALSDDQLEKFAELIVRECAELTLDYKNEAHYNGWLDHCDAIRKHFGVE